MRSVRHSCDAVPCSARSKPLWGCRLPNLPKFRCLQAQAEMFGNLRYARKNAPVSRIFLFGHSPAHRAGLALRARFRGGLSALAEVYHEKRMQARALQVPCTAPLPAFPFSWCAARSAIPRQRLKGRLAVNGKPFFREIFLGGGQVLVALRATLSGRFLPAPFFIKPPKPPVFGGCTPFPVSPKGERREVS